MNQSFDFKHFQTDAGGALRANLFPFEHEESSRYASCDFMAAWSTDPKA